jgi:SNF2 family DNA or RNA helicase
VTIARAIGTPKQRRAAFASDAQIVVINVDNVVWATNEGLLAGFDTLVIDESTRFKNARSNRWKALKKVLPQFTSRFALTGTPTTQGLQDLFAQVYLVDKGQAFGASFYKWREYYFRPLDPNGWKWAPKHGALEVITKSIAPFTFQIEPGDYAAQLPELVINDLVVELPHAARALYDQLKEDFVVGEVSAASGGVLVNKLAQIANGFIYTGDAELGTQQAEWLHDAKLDALEEVIESQQGAPLLVLYRYRAELEAMRKRWPAPYLGSGVSNVTAAKTIADWNAGRLPILYGHPASMGHGLNLQDGGSTIVWYGLPWSLEEWQQAIARLHRSGQKSTVWVHRIVAADTVDREILEALRTKRRVQDLVVEHVKQEAK